jgi:hypothetical protein
MVIKNSQIFSGCARHFQRVYGSIHAQKCFVYSSLAYGAKQLFQQPLCQELLTHQFSMKGAMSGVGAITLPVCSAIAKSYVKKNRLL